MTADPDRTSPVDALILAACSLAHSPMYHDCKGPLCLLCGELVCAVEEYEAACAEGLVS